MDTNGNGPDADALRQAGLPPEIKLIRQVIVGITDKDQVMVFAPDLTMDRCEVILQRGLTYAKREVDAARFAIALEERAKRVQIAAPTRLPPPPGGPR